MEYQDGILILYGMLVNKKYMVNINQLVKIINNVLN